MPCAGLINVIINAIQCIGRFTAIYQIIFYFQSIGIFEKQSLLTKVLNIILQNANVELGTSIYALESITGMYVVLTYLGMNKKFSTRETQNYLS